VVTQPIGSFGRTDGFQTKIKIPAHQLKFDENKFLRLMAGSISLTKDEKKRIIEAVPKLTQFQVDELIRILQEEKDKFSALDVKHKEQLRGLESKHAQEWEDLEMEMTAGDAKKAQEAQLAQARAAAAALQKPANNPNAQPPQKKSA
jgi:peptidoglycan hydrolase CwlO-like protein